MFVALSIELIFKADGGAQSGQEPLIQIFFDLMDAIMGQDKTRGEQRIIDEDNGNKSTN